MARFKRLTDAEARTLDRSELLDRVEAESAYWDRKIRRGLTDEDRAAHREFGRIMHAYLDPAAMIQELLDRLKAMQPSRPTSDTTGRAGLEEDTWPG